MPVQKLNCVALPEGRFSSSWFDDDQLLWDDQRLHKGEALAARWQAPTLKVLHAPLTPILFNPNAIAVSSSVAAGLSQYSELEFLPIVIGASDPYFILHVTKVIDAPPRSSLRCSPVSGNIVEIFKFPNEFDPYPGFFRIAQPKDSAAGRAGYCYRAVFLGEQASRSINELAGSYLKAYPI